MSAPRSSNLDADQCIRGAYDDATGSLRTNTTITAPLDVNGEVLVDIRSTDGDSVLVVGTENGTATGVQHVLEVDSSNNLHVVDTNANTILTNIQADLINFNTTPVQTVQIFTKPYDSVTVTYPTTTQEIFQSRVGGISGTVQQTVTINYTDITKNFILNVART